MISSQGNIKLAPKWALEPFQQTRYLSINSDDQTDLQYFEIDQNLQFVQKFKRPVKTQRLDRTASKIAEDRPLISYLQRLFSLFSKIALTQYW